MDIPEINAAFLHHIHIFVIGAVADRVGKEIYPVGILYYGCFQRAAHGRIDIYPVREFLAHLLLPVIMTTDNDDLKPDRVFFRYILNLMMNALNHGSGYAKDLFIYLYKTYYRKEYQQLKRFNSISGNEVLAIATPAKGKMSPISQARVLTMSIILGI